MSLWEAEVAGAGYWILDTGYWMLGWKN